MKERIMCEATAYLLGDNEPTLVMEAVDTIEPEEKGIRLINIFGEQKSLKARIHSLSLVDNKVFLKEKE
jgi:predicted RNA-binding protein